MPASLTYPGVYIEEIPSGVRTITGVATSITAFVGRTARGPSDKAQVINSFAEFESTYGGLWRASALGFSVRDFFLNGGSQAVIVRLYNPAPDPNNPPNGTLPSKRALTVGGLALEAASEGTWGLNLRAAVDKNNLSDDVAAALGVTKGDLFNLTVRDVGPGGTTETFLNVTAVASPRRIDDVLTAGSNLVRCQGTPAAPTEGVDPLSALEKAYADAKTAYQQAQIGGGDTTATKTAMDKAKADLDKGLADAAKTVSDGTWLTAKNFFPAHGATLKTGLFALEQTDLFNLLVIPPYLAPGTNPDVDSIVVGQATAYCEQRRAVMVVDAPSTWTDKSKATAGAADFQGNVGTNSRNAALFFPRLVEANPLNENKTESFSGAGAVAGIMARTDAQRGVWKAPAGLDATFVGISSFNVALTDAENGELNHLAVNCLRAFPVLGKVVWGSRTMRGADQLADEYKYLPVRRTALFLEESLYRGLKWVVFEPNDEPLWSQIRLNVGAFMHNLFRQGAFQGTTPRDAYFVKCDKETTTQNDIDLGIVNVIVGFAPLKPAEFVVVKIQQMAGQIEV